MQPFDLYLILDRGLVGGRDIFEIVRKACAGGVDVIQYRDKHSSESDIMRLCIRLRQEISQEGALFIINDFPAVARRCSADGVHLGQGDMSLSKAREIMGESGRIGISTHCLAQACAAEREGADYIGIGPVFPTALKRGWEAIGVEGVRAVSQAVTLPCIAIGGITEQMLEDVVYAGANAIAAGSAILQSDNIEDTVRRFKQKIKEAKEQKTIQSKSV